MKKPQKKPSVSAVVKPLLHLSFPKFPKHQVGVFFLKEKLEFEAKFGFESYTAPSVSALKTKIEAAIKKGATPEPVWVPMIAIGLDAEGGRPDYKQSLDFELKIAIERQYYCFGRGHVLLTCDWDVPANHRNKKASEDYGIFQGKHIGWRNGNQQYGPSPVKTLDRPTFIADKGFWSRTSIQALIPYSEELWKELQVLVSGLRGDAKALIQATSAGTLDALQKLALSFPKKKSVSTGGAQHRLSRVSPKPAKAKKASRPAGESKRPGGPKTTEPRASALGTKNGANRTALPKARAHSPREQRDKEIFPERREQFLWLVEKLELRTALAALRAGTDDGELMERLAEIFAQNPTVTAHAEWVRHIQDLELPGFAVFVRSFLSIPSIKSIPSKPDRDLDTTALIQWDRAESAVREDWLRSAGYGLLASNMAQLSWDKLSRGQKTAILRAMREAFARGLEKLAQKSNGRSSVSSVVKKTLAPIPNGDLAADVVRQLGYPAGTVITVSRKMGNAKDRVGNVQVKPPGCVQEQYSIGWLEERLSANAGATA